MDHRPAKMRETSIRTASIRGTDFGFLQQQKKEQPWRRKGRINIRAPFSNHNNINMCPRPRQVTESSGDLIRKKDN